jgi:hypothetical protein
MVRIARLVCIHVVYVGRALCLSYIQDKDSTHQILEREISWNLNNNNEHTWIITSVMSF